MLIKPSLAWITTNRSCNFRCLWCYGKGEHFNVGQTLSRDLSLRLLSIIKQLGIHNVTIIGGEPTLWKHLLEFNKECRNACIQTALVTNGQRFSDDSYWSEYVKNPNDRVSPSIKAFDAESGKRFARITDFERVKKGLNRLVEKYACGISFVFNSFVKTELVAMAQFARSCGAFRVSISPCTPSFVDGGIDTTGMVSLQEMVKLITNQYPRLHELMDGGITLSIKTPLCLWPKNFIQTIKERGQLHTGCQFQNRSGIVFGPSGELLACNSMSKFPIGKLGQDYDDADSLISLLNNDRVTHSYNHINSYPSERCIGCPQINSCGGGCPLLWTVFDAKTSIPGCK